MIFSTYMQFFINAAAYPNEYTKEHFIAESGGSERFDLEGVTIDELDFIWEFAHDFSMNFLRKKCNTSRASFTRKYALPYRTMEEWEAGRAGATTYLKHLLGFAVLSEFSFEQSNPESKEYVTY